MEKINFKNYEDEQTTPINAQALNAIQDNVESAINNIDVSEKADITYVDSELELKADKTYVDTKVNKKVNKTYVDTELGKKADTSSVNTELDKKADKTYVDSELELKADITYVNTELGLKADTTYVDSELELKADITYVDSELELKADIATTYTKTETDNSLGLKADTTYVDNELGKKEDKPEIITSGNSRAIKYADGTLICSCKYIAINTPINVAIGSVAHRSAAFLLPNYLVEFVDPPAVTFGIEQNITANRLLSVNPQAASERTDRPPYIFIGSLGGTVSGYAAELTAPKISYIAIGKWK